MSNKNIVIIITAFAIALCIILAVFIYDKESTKTTVIIQADNVTEISNTYKTTTDDKVKITHLNNSTDISISDGSVSTFQSEIVETESEAETAAVVFPLNLNTASEYELAQLDGIGEKLAAMIVDLRNIKGRFKNRNELLEVYGIGEKKLAAIYNDIYVENEVFETETSAQISNAAEQDAAENNNQSVTENIANNGDLNIELNSCTYDDLMKLPDMTDTIANNILTLRDKIQYFSDTHELLYADGMTKNYYNEIKDMIFVENNQ